MSSNREELALIQRLKVSCVKKLRANSHKSHWRGSPQSYYEARTIAELEELRAAISEGKTPDEVWDEAADVANFVAIIASNYEAAHGPVRDWRAC